MTTSTRFTAGSGFGRCRHCGGPVASHDRRATTCSTCYRPEPERSAYARRIALYAARAAAGLRIFDGLAAPREG